MEIKESIRAGLRELILPEIDKIREENTEIKTILTLTNKRLDDINTHLADQSRRIDETNKRIDTVREELGQRIDETNKRMDGMSQKFDSRLDRLYEVIVRRDEHGGVERRVTALEQDIVEIKRRLAA